jgi:hypothetical protein
VDLILICFFEFIRETRYTSPLTLINMECSSIAVIVMFLLHEKVSWFLGAKLKFDVLTIFYLVFLFLSTLS